MPSSHGGGFGGGGSFGGGGFHSSGGSHSGGGYTPRYSHRHFPGATRYSYMNPAGVMCVFYYAGRPTRVKKSSVALFAALLAFMLILTVIVPMLMMPRKLPASYCKYYDSYYVDNAGVIEAEDTEALNNALAAFYDKTGVQPVIYTLNVKDFPLKYGAPDKYGLEEYAYDLYLDLFDDEGHWLIVLVQFNSPSDSFGWIDMCGDDAQDIINDGFFKEFQRDMQNNLGRHGTSYGKEFTLCINNATERAFEKNGDVMAPVVMFILIFLFLDVFIGIALVSSIKQYFMINGYLDYEEKNARNEAMNEQQAFVKHDLDEDPFK